MARVDSLHSAQPPQPLGPTQVDALHSAPADVFVKTAGELVGSHMDIDALMAATQPLSDLEPPPPPLLSPSAAALSLSASGRRVRVAVAEDRCFHSGYPE